MGLFDGIDMNQLQQIFGAAAGPNAPMMPTPPPQLPLTPEGGSNFSDRFNASRPTGVASASPVSPENIAHNLAARGVPPPPVDVPPAAATPAPNLPVYRNDVSPQAMDNWRADVDVGSALTGNNPTAGSAVPNPPKMPMDISTPVQQAENAAAAAGTPSAKGNLGTALSGLKMPANPTIQHIASPAAPKANARVQPSQLLALLQQLGVGGAAPNLPSTLGQAIRRG